MRAPWHNYRKRLTYKEAYSGEMTRWQRFFLRLFGRHGAYHDPH